MTEEQDSVEDADGFRLSGMFEADPLLTLAALWFALSEARRLYEDQGLPPPPIPPKVSIFPPCSLLVTERHNIVTGERIGRILFRRPDGTVLSDQQWAVEGRKKDDRPQADEAH